MDPAARGWTPHFSPSVLAPPPLCQRLLARGSQSHVYMCCTCSYTTRMPKMIQLRQVPDDLHRKLKARAALEGLSLSDYLLAEIRRTAERPTVAELRTRIAQRAPVVTRVPPARAVRAEREHR
jgi:plasmid stability protein